MCLQRPTIFRIGRRQVETWRKELPECSREAPTEKHAVSRLTKAASREKKTISQNCEEKRKHHRECMGTFSLREGRTGSISYRRARRPKSLTSAEQSTAICDEIIAVGAQP
jgi:hypothetical protein